ncbi:hypothetical protein K1719_011450 [Acacia pycnantha]|nr:hypothetical protein K1719_011450 [Acacia pycnantha]
MGRLFLIDLEGDFYSCKYCNMPLALANDVISESFYFRRGKAYLFNNVVNVTFGDEHSRFMITGRYTIVEIFCVKCGSNVGWKYVSTQRQTEQYKVGKFILKRFMVLGPDGSTYVPPV